MIDVREAMEVLLATLKRHGVRSGPGEHECIRAEIHDAIARSGSAISADEVCEAVETGDVALCRESGVTLGALVVWSVALRSAAPSFDAVILEACDAGLSYLFVLPETAYQRPGISHESRQGLLLKLELAVRRALAEPGRSDLFAVPEAAPRLPTHQASRRMLARCAGIAVLPEV